MDSAVATALKAPALYAEAEVVGAAAAWGELAIDIDIVSPLASQAAAATAAAAQAAFMAGQKARDHVTVRGYRSDLEMQLVTLTGPGLGYEAGALVLVLMAIENDGFGTTTLTVLRRL